MSVRKGVLTMPLGEFTIDEVFPDESVCVHVFEEYELTKHDGVVFCTWTCTQCHRKVHQLIGEAFPPDISRDSAFAAKIPGTYQAGDITKLANESIKQELRKVARTERRKARRQEKKAAEKAAAVGQPTPAGNHA